MSHAKSFTPERRKRIHFAVSAAVKRSTQGPCLKDVVLHNVMIHSQLRFFQHCTYMYVIT